MSFCHDESWHKTNYLKTMVSIINKAIVKELAQRYQHTRNCMVVGYQGLKSLEANELRKDLYTKKIRLEVVKDSLASLAFKEIGLEGVGRLLEGPSALVIGPMDSAVLAKTVVEWSKKVPALKIRGGMVEGKVISSPEVEVLSRLPTKPVLHTQFVTLLQAPLSRLAAVLSAPLHKLRGDLEALKDKREKESTSAAPAS